MANKQKYISSIGFTDLLFNIVVGLAFLFILAFVLINPISKEKDIQQMDQQLINSNIKYSITSLNLNELY